jgi:hypothetical protein
MTARTWRALALVTGTALAVSMLLATPATAVAPQLGQALVPAPAPGAPETLTNTERPRIKGSSAYGKRLTGRVGTWSGSVDDFDYRWLRDDAPITGATGRHYRVRTADVGAKIRLEVTAKRAGATPATAVSRAVTGKHVRGVRKVVTYPVDRSARASRRSGARRRRPLTIRGAGGPTASGSSGSRPRATSRSC